MMLLFTDLCGLVQKLARAHDCVCVCHYIWAVNFFEYRLCHFHCDFLRTLMAITLQFLEWKIKQTKIYSINKNSQNLQTSKYLNLLHFSLWKCITSLKKQFGCNFIQLFITKLNKLNFRRKFGIVFDVLNFWWKIESIYYFNALLNIIFNMNIHCRFKRVYLSIIHS